MAVPPLQAYDVIEDQSGAEDPSRDAVISVIDKQEAQRVDQAPPLLKERFPLSHGMVCQAKLGLAQVAKAAMHKFGGAAGCAGGEILTLNEENSQTHSGRLAQYTCAGNSSTYYNEIPRSVEARPNLIAPSSLPHLALRTWPALPRVKDSLGVESLACPF